VWEDNHYSTRAFNHFFDPQADKMSGRPLTVGASLGNTSPDWILEDRNTTIDRLTLGAQEFSFRRAQEQLFNSLIGEYPSTRFAAFSKVLQSLGHVVHHIQDMAQPQHVRNDQHTHPLPGTKYNPDWSFYEQWTLKETEAGNTAPIASQYYPIPVFPTARQFWYTPTTSSTEYYTGMAEFTSKNFVSFGTEYRSTLSAAPTVTGADGFPLPNGYNPNGTPKRLGPAVVEKVGLPDGSTVTGEVEYLYGDVYDGLTNTTRSNVKLGSATLVSSFLAAKASPYRPLRFSENTAIYRDAHQMLLPRAVAFSAGLIDHFFRGRIDLKRGSGDNWLIENRSGQEMSGMISVYAEDVGGRRLLVGNTMRQATLAAGQTYTLNFVPPETTTKLVGVFRGRIGSEGDASLLGFYATAGRVIPYVPPVPAAPAVPCGKALFAGGGQSGYSQAMELGASGGTVNVKFQAYQIEDSLEIKYPNGKVLVTTNGLVPGETTASFQHTPTSGTQVQVRVLGNPYNSQTAWTLSVSCPGQTTPPPPAVPVTWGVDQPDSVSTTGGIARFACSGNWSFIAPSDFGGLVGGKYNLTEGKTYQYTLRFSGSMNNCSVPVPYYIDGFGKHQVNPYSSAGRIFIQSYGGGGGG